MIVGPENQTFTLVTAQGKIGAIQGDSLANGPLVVGQFRDRGRNAG